MRFKVTWNGMVHKSLAVETAADPLYHIWSRYRDDFPGGTVEVVLDEGGSVVRLAQLSFPVRIRREIEAENPAEAVRTFLHDDRVPGLPRVEDIQVEPVADPPPDGVVEGPGGHRS